MRAPQAQFTGNELSLTLAVFNSLVLLQFVQRPHQTFKPTLPHLDLTSNVGTSSILSPQPACSVAMAQTVEPALQQGEARVRRMAP